jgi:hypothetical protein
MTLLTITCALITVESFSNEKSLSSIPEHFKTNVHLDLKNPNYAKGTFQTQEGGIVKGNDYRIQAKEIYYHRDNNTTPPTETIKAQEALMMDYGDYQFVAKRLEFNISKNEGTLYQAETKIQGWYIGGEKIDLLSDGSFFIENAHITSCESQDKDWEIKIDKVLISKERIVNAENFKIFFGKIPLFWLPKVKTSISTMLDAPVSYKASFGGGQGPRVGIKYRFFSSPTLNTFFHLDYRLKRGFGSALSAQYKKENREFFTRNYIAYDTSILDPEKRHRFRFEGNYKDLIYKDKVETKLQYDRLSDREVVTDFYDKNFNLEKPLRTELSVYYPEDKWKASLEARIKVNPFQSVLEETPKISIAIHPYKIGKSPFISVSNASISYLTYKFADTTSSPSNYESLKLSLQEELYAPFYFKDFIFTPNVKLLGLVYTNGPEDTVNQQTVAKFSGTLNRSWYRMYGKYRHSITPYTQYTYLWTMNNPFAKHYLFDINDAYVPLNMLKMGAQSSIYTKRRGQPKELFGGDLYTIAFFNQNTMKTTFQRIYLSFNWHPFESLYNKINFSWDTQHHTIAHYNYHLSYAINENIALDMELLHRSKWDWRKANYENYMLNVYQNENSLLNSSLSDARNSFITRAAFRLGPTTTFNLITRNGWGRNNQRAYQEWRSELSQILYCTWKVDLYYLYTEAEKRIGANVSFLSYPRKKDRKSFSKR